MPLSVLAGAHRFELDVRKSRFVCHASRVASPDDALAFIESTVDPSATHNCWAWRIGQNYRSSDDGEPAGTAGRPILAAIDGQCLDRTVAVVARWFGGIKLGAGGLMRAYGGCAAECLRNAAREPLETMTDVILDLTFADLGTAHQMLAGFAAEKLAERFHTEGACLILRLPEQRLPLLSVALRDATHGRCVLRPSDKDTFDE
jgi:uncharacterized YigZ family protein